MVRLGVWLGLFALYLMLAGTVGLHEAATGFVVAGLLTAWARRTGRHAPRRFVLSRAALPWGGRALARLIPATGRTALTLVRAILGHRHPGHAVRRPFLHGPEDDPRERGRRACALLLASLSPDSFVLRADPGRDEALVHSLGPAGSPPDPRWLA